MEHPFWRHNWHPTRERHSIAWGKLVVHLLLTLIGLACLIPMILVISISLSDDRQLALQGYSLLPVGFSTFAYEYILQQAGRRFCGPMA